MKNRPDSFFQCYQKALRVHLDQGSEAGPDSAEALGIQAIAEGLTILNLAEIHEQILIMVLLPEVPVRKRGELARRAEHFLAAAIAPVGPGHLPADLAASNARLNHEITRRKNVEIALMKSELDYSHSLEESDVLKEELRGLSRRILSAQEDERRYISRELHGVIAQTLIGINVRLATLKKEAALNTRGLDRGLAVTQRLVTKSANIVTRFARELHSSVLDDLGLIPALHGLLKAFMERTGVRAQLTAFAGIEKLDLTRRTLLYRVVEEALANVELHAKAARIEVDVRMRDKQIRMSIMDDGSSFDVPKTMLNRDRNCTGLLGMRERLEMAGGTFDIHSAPGHGTTIIALIPVRNVRKKSNARKPSIPLTPHTHETHQRPAR